MVIWNRRDRKGLAVNILIAVAVAVLANAFIFIVNPAEDWAPPTYRWQPPGYVIGIVWVCLFMFLGTARWLVIGQSNRTSRAPLWIWGLLLFCAAYPIYTLGLRSLTLGLVGNIATAILAVCIALQVRRTSRVAAGLVATVAVWVTFASLLIVEQMRGLTG